MANLVGAEEGAEEEFALLLGKTRQERVQDASSFAVAQSSLPGTVAVFICLRLYQIIDDLVVRSTCSTKDKTSSGSREISKSWGMSCGTEECSR